MPSPRTVSANGIEIFLLEQGEGPLVLFCHGWPELSYSWRHQIPAIAAAGFHVAAPDMRTRRLARGDVPPGYFHSRRRPERSAAVPRPWPAAR
jgi:pimeloyl-ACP methyl ester carboxylesterase